MIIENFQIGFLECFKILIKNNPYFIKLINKDSDNVMIIISLFSIIIYFYIIFFIKKINQIANKNLNYNYLKNNIKNNFTLSISQENFQKIFTKNISFKNILYDFCKENIKKKYNLNNNMFVIITERDTQYSILFEKNHIIYQEINKNELLYYDEYYDIYNANLLINNKNNLQSIVLKEILNILDFFNIRLIIPIKNHNSYIIIFQNTYNIKKDFNNNDFEYFFLLIEYLKNCDDNLKSQSVYSKLIYENKIAELNLIEENNIYQKNYKDLNAKINQIEQVFIYDNNKNNIKIFSQKNSKFNSEYIKILENNPVKEIYNNLSFTFNKNNKEISILSNEKILINNNYGSIHTIFSFFKKENNNIKFLLKNEKINLIFESSEDLIDQHKYFFNNFYNNYNIKIIIINDNNAKSFFKIIEYTTQTECIYICLKSINFIKHITAIIQKLINFEKKYYIFFTNINNIKNNIQKKILELYLNIINNNIKLIKLFFIINQKNTLNLIDPEILSIANIININNISLNDIKKENFIEILKNYSENILKKNYSLEIIKEINNNYFVINLNTNIYLFFDFFEKIIEIHTSKNFLITSIDIFYINNAIKLKKNCLKNIFLMEKIGRICNFNYQKIATLLNINKSTVIKYYKNI